MVTTRSRQPKIEESLKPKKRSASPPSSAKTPSTKKQKVKPASSSKKSDDVKPVEKVEPAEGAHSTEVKGAEKKLVSEKDVLEYGRIHFLYKPRVETFHPHSIDDVQRLHIILQPHSLNSISSSSETTDEAQKPVLSRLLNVGRKVLPGPGDKDGKRKQPFWAFVSAVAEDVSELHDWLAESKKETKTLGTRTTPSSHLIASGPYAILLHPSDSSDAASSNPTSLVYRTTIPAEMGEVQKAFNIAREGSFTVTVKNPKFPNTGGSSGPSGRPGGLSGNQKADYPSSLQSEFGDLRWHPLSPPTFLNHPSCELLLIASHPSSSSAIEDDAGSAIAHEMHDIADEGLGHGVPEEEMRKVEEEVLEMLKLREEGEGGVSGEELITGKWE